MAFAFWSLPCSLIFNFPVSLEPLCTSAALVPTAAWYPGLPHTGCAGLTSVGLGPCPQSLGMLNAALPCNASSRQRGLTGLQLQASSGMPHRSQRGVNWNSTVSAVRETAASLLSWLDFISLPSSPLEAQDKPSPLCHLTITLPCLLQTLDVTNSLFCTNSVPKKYS